MGIMVRQRAVKIKIRHNLRKKNNLLKKKPKVIPNLSQNLLNLPLKSKKNKNNQPRKVTRRKRKIRPNQKRNKKKNMRRKKRKNLRKRPKKKKRRKTKRRKRIKKRKRKRN